MKHSLKVEDYIYVNDCCVRKGLTEEQKVRTWCFYPFFQDRSDTVASFRWGLGENLGLNNGFAHSLFDSGLVYDNVEYARENLKRCDINEAWNYRRRLGRDDSVVRQ